MNKVMLAAVFFLMLAGCTKEQQTQQMEPTPPPPSLKVAEIVKEEPVVGAAPVKPIKGAEQIIAENSWGFAAYDPQTGREEFYTSDGALLGNKKR